MLACLAVLLFVPPSWCLDEKKHEPQSPRQQYEAVMKKYRQALQLYDKAKQAAKTEEDRSKVIKEKRPEPNKYAGQMLEIAEKNPNDPVAVDACLWVVQQGMDGPMTEKAWEVLTARADGKNLKDPCRFAGFSASPSAEKFLRAVLAKNPDRTTKAAACLSLAELLVQRSEQAQTNDSLRMSMEAEALYARIIKEFADVRHRGRPMLDAAKGGLNEIRLLGIGKLAPDIAGEDTDGKKFKLSDYRGKVVLLDFWGNW
jgi:hypothetical protein